MPIIAAVLLGIIVLLPIAAVVIASFTAGRPGNLGGFTVSNYVESVNLPWYWITIGRTVLTGVCGVVVALIITGPMAWLATRTDAYFGPYLDYIGMAPIFISQFTIAIAWRLIASEELGIFNHWLAALFGDSAPSVDVDSFWGIVWISALYFSPFLYLFIANALRAVDPSFEEASMVLGGSTKRTAWSITLPMIRPALFGGSLLVFMLLMSQFTIPLIFGWNAGFHVLTTKIYEITVFPPARYGLAASLSAITVAIGLVALMLYRKSIAKAGYASITGKGLRTIRIELGKWRMPVLCMSLLYALLVVILPYGIIVLTSLQRFTGAPAPYTLEQFSRLFGLSFFPIAVRTTLVMAIGGTTLAVVLAGIISWSMVRRKGRLSSALDFVAMSPMAVPGTVFALGVMWAWIRVPGIWASIWILVLGLTAAHMTFAVRSLASGLLQIAPELEESSAVSGASPWRTIRNIVLPLLKPSFATAWILVFTLFYRNVSVVALLWSSNNMPLSVLGLDLWQREGYPIIAALALVDTAIFFTLVTVVRKLTGTGLRKLV